MMTKQKCNECGKEVDELDLWDKKNMLCDKCSMIKNNKNINLNQFFYIR
jgi:DNA-directed RNA polymerase subunit RPC12/RpoP